MRERKTQNLSERIYCDILRRVLDGEYNEGDRLTTEHALASRFESSRATVREALAQLRADGIIATRHGSGTIVQRCPDPNVLKFAPLTSLSDIKRCYEFRVVTESGAAALAPPGLTVVRPLASARRFALLFRRVIDAGKTAALIALGHCIEWIG